MMVLYQLKIFLSNHCPGFFLVFFFDSLESVLTCPIFKSVLGGFRAREPQCHIDGPKAAAGATHEDSSTGPTTKWLKIGQVKTASKFGGPYREL
jgi:hypothetical protein